MSRTFLSAVDSNMAEFKELNQQAEDVRNTRLTPLETTTEIKVTLENSGRTKLANFEEWDFFMDYTDNPGNHYAKWLAYTEDTPGDDQWTVEGIYLDAGTGTPEVLEPGVLNPGEKVVLEAKTKPEPDKNYTHRIVIVTPNGVTTTTYILP